MPGARGEPGLRGPLPWPSTAAGRADDRGDRPDWRLAVVRFQRMPFLAQVKEAKLRAFVVPGQALQVEARLLHDGSGYAMAAGSLSSGGERVADAEITYRVVPFPH